MFDYINCEHKLPDTPIPPPTNKYFQTKDTPDQGMAIYTITADGRLTWKPYIMEEVPEAERWYPNDDGLLGLFGSLRRVEGDPQTLDWHGDIYFYKSSSDHSGWWEYRARFTEGRLSGIALIEFIPPDKT